MGICYTPTVVFGFQISTDTLQNYKQIPSYQQCQNDNCPKTLISPYCSQCGKQMRMINTIEMSDLWEKFFELANQLPPGYVWERDYYDKNTNWIGWGLTAELDSLASADIEEIPTVDEIENTIKNHFQSIISHIDLGKCRLYLVTHGY